MRFKSRSRALVGAAAAGLLGLAGLTMVAPTAGAEPADTERLAGAERWGTAADIATEAYPNGTDTVVLANGLKFPDALSVGGLAGQNDAPILLTLRDSLPADTEAGLTALDPTNIIVAGGSAVVSDALVAELEADGFNVTRVFGADRFETAAEIAGELGAVNTVFLANGLKFPDALAISPGSAKAELPVLLTQQDTLNAHAEAAIEASGADNVVILGGNAAVSDDIEAQLEADGKTVTRVQGATRYETATAVADYLIANHAFSANPAHLATGEKFPDALAGGPFAAINNGPIILTFTNSLAPAAQAWLEANAAAVDFIWVFGGAAAVSDATVAAAAAAADESGGAAAATIRPELISAEIVQTVTAGQATPTRPAGTYVTYTFDEAVELGVITPGNFKVYNANSNLADTGDAATVQPGATTVEVRFNSLNTAASAANLTVATVVENAVEDAQGNSNPEGDAAIGDASTGTLTPGITAAPDVQSVSGFRQGANVGQTAVDFTFDEAATVQNTTGFQLVLQDNTVQACTSSTTPASSAPSGGTSPGGSGTTTITVVCNNPNITGSNPGGTPLSTANVARGVVQLSTVADSTGVLNPLQIADAGNSGNTSGPDLVSGQLIQGSTNDSALYTFDVNVTTATANLFHAYTSAGSQINGASAAISATDPRQVLVTFTGNTALDSAVGVSVSPNAVNSAVGMNERDEVGVANTAETTVTPGRTAAPDLTGVSVTATSGFVPAYATYTFDQDVEPGANIVDANFHLYTSAGVRITATDCARGTTYSGTGAGGNAADSSTASASVSCAFGLVGDSTANSRVINAVLGTVSAGAVDDDTNTALTNPEGAELTTGGTGTPAS